MSESGGQPGTGATASSGPTHAEDYPKIAGWLASAGPDHPWQRLLSMPVEPGVSRPTLADTMLGPLEVMALIVRNAGPEGLVSFITQFRDADMKNVLGRRLELLCAFNLTVQQLPYAFGQTGEPDFVWRRGGPEEGRSPRQPGRTAHPAAGPG